MKADIDGEVLGGRTNTCGMEATPHGGAKGGFIKVSATPRIWFLLMALGVKTQKARG